MKQSAIYILIAVLALSLTLFAANRFAASGEQLSPIASHIQSGKPAPLGQSQEAESTLSPSPHAPTSGIKVEAPAVVSPNSTAKSAVPSMLVYRAEQTSGVIGTPEGIYSDNPEDNVFSIVLSEKPGSTDRVRLVYELNGVASGYGVSKSINDRPASGGYLTALNDEWSEQRESLAPAWMEKGANRILFTLPADAPYGYSVRNVRIEVQKGTGNTEIPAVYAETVGNKTYIRGLAAPGVTRVMAGETELAMHDGEFEGIVPATAHIELTADKIDGTGISRSITSVLLADKADFARTLDKNISSAEKAVEKGESAQLQLDGGKLTLDETALLKSKTLSVTALRDVDIPALDHGMSNVTAQHEGYRFLPHGTHFAEKGATVSLAYDRTRIPSGYTEDDIRTYYFDNQTKHWVALERDSVDRENSLIVSATTHFTDMINGVIQAPESPETQGFAPTMMNDIKAADPTAKLNIIAPPSPNNRGSAGLDYSFEMPPARNGMTPSLGIRYDSDAGSGWLGEGWNIALPGISVDTRWGVPRYNPEKETETYSMSGAMLTTTAPDGTMSVAHRGEKIDRTSGRQFYTRQGGDFARIIRKGDSPGNYIWEVTDKQGTKYIYGGNGGTLKGTITDINGQQREVITEWKLSRVEETHGDWVEYSYSPADESVRGSLTAKALYLTQARAGNRGEQAHTLVTFESGTQKELKTNNARYGFLTSSNRLLDKLTVAYRGETLRSYTFTYKKGAFFKETLTEIKQLDNNGVEFAHQKFDYYDDVKSSEGYTPFVSESENWNTGEDNISAKFANPVARWNIPGFSNKATALGGSLSNSKSFFTYIGVGLLDGHLLSKSNTVGYQYGHSRNDTKGLASLIDINGDGLPDKVYKNGNEIYFRPQIRKQADTDEVSFGEQLRIDGVNDFSQTTSITNTHGFRGHPLIAMIGNDQSFTNTWVNSYFEDVNGDGLVDIVSNGKVYFNTIKKDEQGNAFPFFTPNSSLSPSPIHGGGNIDKGAFEPTDQEREEAVKVSPLQDVVRVWEAPFAGSISVGGTVQLQLPSGNYDEEAYRKADGVRLAIQKGSTELWSKQIPKGDATEYPAQVATTTVTKGQRIYFRVQSGNGRLSNGAFDQVKWNPIITYTDNPNVTTADGYGSAVFKAGEGFVVSNKGSLTLPSGVDFTVKGTWVKPITSDNVTLRIVGSNNPTDAEGNPNPAYKENVLFEKTFGWNETHSGELTANVANTHKDQNMRFEVYAQTNVAWDTVKWSPVLSYTIDAENVSMRSPVSYSIYPELIAKGGSYNAAATGYISVKPELRFNPLMAAQVNGKLTVSVKTPIKLLGKKSFTVTAGQLPANALLDSVAVDTGAVWVEYTFDKVLSAIQTDTVRAIVTPLPTGTPATVSVNLYAMRENNAMGNMHRGWGQFIYNANNDRYASPIDENILKMPEKEQDATLDKIGLIPMNPDPATYSFWMGGNDLIYLKGEDVSASRLGNADVVLTNPFDDINIDNPSGGDNGCPVGTGAVGIVQHYKSGSSTNITGGGVGPISGSVNKSEGWEETRSMFTDMNGDGFPDIISKESIQFTNTRGGFDGESLKGDYTHHSTNTGYAVGLGGEAIISKSNSSKQNAQGNAGSSNTSSGQTDSNQGATSDANAKASLAPGLDVSWNKDRTVYTLMDVNGDGLPDKVQEDRKVRINMGYWFSEPIEWELDNIQNGQSKTASAGLSLGFTRGNGSISGGFGLVTTFTENEYQLLDINSDGLPDKVWKENNRVMVSLNKGASFAAPILWGTLEKLSNNISTSESLNASGTIGFGIPIIQIKVAVTVGGNLGRSMNRPTFALRDVDGDGYLDIVTSDNDSRMQVTRSAIGRTNKLRSVTNSLGGRFEVDYERSAPTYQNPGSRWVMAQLTVDDGIRDDGPVGKTRFGYSEGRRDRHEREFLGYGTVIAQSIDTENSDAVYRRAVQQYDVRNYYTQGRLIKSRVEDAEGNPFAETRNEYDVYSLKAQADSYTFTKEENICSDRGAAFVPLRYTSNMQYEGNPAPITTSEAYNEYYLDGHFGELKSYKYSDKGTLGSNGSGGYDYQTSVTYAHNRDKHILGLPTQVTVSGGGQTYRQLSATYDMNYPRHITKITGQLGGGQTAVTDFVYDLYGNIVKKTLPANSKGQRMWYSYRYEPVMNMYVERISDAFGYRSEVEEFDYRYGISLKHRDLNNYYSETKVDNLGRIVSVRGPNELAEGKPYAIKFEYKGNHAVTTHYDVQHPDKGIETITFVDGFGRAIQVKKSGVLTNENTDSEVMIVSGRIKYDAFGRAKEAYHPVTEATGSKLTLNTAFDGVIPTKTTYDVLDRTLTVTRPDNAVTTMQYGIDNASNSLVTTVVDAMGGKQTSFARGKMTVKTEQHSGGSGVITTAFTYDGVGQLLKATDAKGGETISVYDMAGRRTQVTHPASGVTKFVYDNANNLLSKQTANLLEKGKMITYEYDYNRLTASIYPDHPENNVKYYYGGVNASHNRIGRLMLMEDGSGAQEYYYGKMGEVVKTRRTLIVPNQAIATYVTQWKYDSHNRLLEMIYPDEEKITYAYNAAGMLSSVRGEKSYGYNYVTKIGYDKFEQRNYIQYCNGVETRYTYDSQTRRLSNLNVLSTKINRKVMDNAYTYDKVDNILSIANTAPLPNANTPGGQMRHNYTYDGLYRLTNAVGTYAGSGTKTAAYALEMAYDNLHNIVSKKQHIEQKDVQFGGTLKAGYELAYSYANTQQVGNIVDANYRVEATEVPNKKTQNSHAYSYDKNGNLIYVNTALTKLDSTVQTKTNERMLRWDEENRLLAVNDNGFVSQYWYDAAGERTVKTSGDGEAVYVNSLFSGGRTGTAKFTLYVSPYLVASQGGKYTKHIYIGSQRIVSKLGDLQSYGADPRRIPYAGSESDNVNVDYKGKYQKQQQIIKNNYATFDVPYNGKDNNNYADGEGFCCDDKPEGSATTRSLTPGQNDNPEKFQFYYHPDHLGSSSYITNLDGNVVQHIEYVPFGEVFLEERNNKWNTPYLFNAKELDEETGLYYYGARYYNPRISLWLSTDPLQEKYPNISSYVYCVNNPVKFIDPTGMELNPIYDLDGNFLGTDNKGLQGAYLIMKKEDFKQGMDSKTAQKKSYLGPISDESRQQIWDHHASLVERPDYDGVVTVSEGIAWAKDHPNALKNPTPDNTLYIDASKLDFGGLSTSDFKNVGEIEPQNLFDLPILKSALLYTLRNTVYALGRVDMILESRELKTVRIVNNSATDYDWNLGGGTKRDSFIRAERLRAGLNDTHGFKTFYYGVGRLKK